VAGTYFLIGGWHGLVMGAGADQLQAIEPCTIAIAMQGCKFSGLDALANFDVPHTEFVHLLLSEDGGNSVNLTILCIKKIKNYTII
jgi:hypothetical protein